ncbi:MAG: sigma factor-like helix-turn-helix DNA-binding protein [Patescibacteria group bacterium]|jgi:transcriptional regulator with XRE-family HTH domain|nr:sigma factor-like helix-turn-helix DNA-binding protein [Patescibacteria group bacterium]
MSKIFENLNQGKTEELSRLNAIKIVDFLFTDLLDREKDILTRRYGLKGGKGETLEKIGSLHNLTRERVRQIESASIKKIKKIEKIEDSVNTLKETISELLEEHGGMLRKDFLLDILTVSCLELENNYNSDTPEYEKNRDIYRNHFSFLISKLIGDDLEDIKSSNEFNPVIKIKNAETDYFKELADDLLNKVDSLKKVLSTEELIELLKELDTYNRHQEKMASMPNTDITKVYKSKIFKDKAEIINSNKILYSLIQAVKDLEMNKFGQWGSTNWSEIKPKTVNDKIYLVLKHFGKPLHFTEIAKKINEIGFDKKKANAATVHNELILDNRYYLESRGTYGLK